MGIFLVFFPEEQTSSISPIKGFLKRTNSNHILTRAQSTISICALLVFLTFLLFTLSSFEPNNDFISNHHNLHQYRRYLTQTPTDFIEKPRSYNSALQGLGTLYARGTTAMNELVIGHVSESVTANELRLFVRAFHRSGLASKADLLFVFDSISTIEKLDGLIREENELFFTVIRRYSTEIGNGSGIGDLTASFDVGRFVKSGRDSGRGDPIWGRKTKGNSNSSFIDGGGGNNGTESTRLSYGYGSVVGFGIGELDPENSLSGFLDPVPMGLRRWASYPMILGRVRRKFKKIILVDVKEVLLLGDPLGRVKSHSAESIIFSSTSLPPKHGRKGAKPHRKTIDPTLILGGERGVRRLAAAMLTEIVRATTRQQHSKKKVTVTESVLLSQLAGNEFLQKSIRFTASTESIPEPSSLGVELANQTVVVRRGNSNFDIGKVIMKHICSFPIESSVYNTDC